MRGNCCNKLSRGFPLVLSALLALGGGLSAQPFAGRAVAVLVVGAYCAVPRRSPLAGTFSPRGRNVARGTATTQPLRRMSSSSSEQTMPTLEELSEDPFIKQVSHAESVVGLLVEEGRLGGGGGGGSGGGKSSGTAGSSDVTSMLKAQLGHSDGIRGFFVTYLTRDDGDGDDNDEAVPRPLVEAMKSVSNVEELVKLASMNVIMPTGMVTMHKDPELSASSRMTAERGARVLACLRSKECFPDVVESHLDAIYQVATSSSGAAADRDGSSSVDDDSEPLVKYWTEFFEKWGYQEEERKNIATAIRSINKI